MILVRQWRREVAAVVGTAMLSVACVACGGSGSSGTAGPSGDSGGSLTLYNGQHEATTRALVAGFEKKTGIDVKVRSGEGSELANQVIAEGSASPADVIYTEDSPALTTVQDKNLLAKVDRSTLAAVPAKDSSGKGSWVGVTARARVMVYNPNLVDADRLPDSVLDLAKPAWRGKVGIEATSGSLAAMVTAIRLRDGKSVAKRWLEGIKRNAKTFNSHDAILKTVNSGQLATGLMNNYYWYRLRDEVGKRAMHAKLHYFPPGDPGSLLNVSGAAALASAPHPKAAQRFLAYLVSPAGQKVIQDSDSYEYPLNPKVSANSALTPLHKIHPLRTPLGKLGRGRNETLQLMRQVGLI
ncbi:MAG: iron ABC transporter substrate-binding protein [Nocardioidaceae bacterium]